MPCPCGYELKSTVKDVAVINDVIVDGLLAAFPAAKLEVMLDPLLGRYLHAATICTQPPPALKEPTIEWYTEPWNHLDDVLNNVIASNWNLWCQCSECPPVTGCDGDNWIEIGTREGDLNEAFYQDYRYLIPGGQTIYVKRLDTNVCFGPFTGLSKDTCLNAVGCGGKTVHFSNSNGTGTVAAVNHESVEPLFRLYFGGGVGGAATPTFPVLPVTVEDPPAAGVCDPTNICTAIQPLADQIEIIRLVLNSVAGGQLGLAGDYSFTLPGLTGPISGTLNEVLARAIEALAPIQPSQLASPATATITGATGVDVTGKAYVRIEFTTIPDSYGSAGDGDTRYYFRQRGTNGLGVVYVMGQAGVLDAHTLHYGAGVEFPVPATATDLAFDLSPGVEVEVTAWGRTV